MVELHLVHHGTHEGLSAGSQATIRRIMRSLEPDVEADER